MNTLDKSAIDQLTLNEVAEIQKWFREDVLSEAPNAHIDQVVVFVEPKELYTSILCEYEMPDQSIQVFRLAGKKR
jgi:agmatine/peptidylarginine deiminase